MQTLALIGRRILYAAFLLLAVIVLNFTLIRLAPGDIVQTIAGQMGGMNEELMLELRHSFQLDKSIPEQLLIYIGKVAHGDLGYSYFFNQPVLDLIDKMVAEIGKPKFEYEHAAFDQELKGFRCAKYSCPTR